MFIRILLISILSTSFSFSANKGFEYSGIMVKDRSKGKIDDIVVKRDIDPVCKKVPINNTMLWEGNYANTKVPDVCKFTFVVTPGKLLPMYLDEDLETYGELEVLAFIKEMQHDDTMLLIDSRKKPWYDYRTIPGAINMPFHYFKERDAFEFHFEYGLKHLGVFIQKDGEYDFSDAKTLVLFCNGPWCSQSPA
ncbi:MAG: rhodanese-like domain-containing protein, partial [Campylobacterota bacterium]|nr:rhodanese-like domain-containing protein [Campylobacterota bacterium]